MSDDKQDPSVDAWDAALSARLGKLRSIPVDTTALDRGLRTEITRGGRPSSPFRVRPFRAVAASFLVLFSMVAALLVTSSGGPALAEGAQMAQVHQDIVSGRMPVMQVDSIESANRMLNSRSPGAPTLPNIPDSHVMACCMKSVHNKKMACVLLKDGGIPVTLAVASSADVHMPSTPVTRYGGVDYRVQRVGKLSMVMTERNGKWLCLIGETAAERLMDIATQVQF